jgi:Family of unknown function (DUF6502)
MRKRVPGSDPTPATGIQNHDIDWKSMVDRIVWLLRKAGVTSEEIEQTVAESTRRHAGTRSIKIPSQTQIGYSHVISYWQANMAYLDSKMRPKALPLQGPPPSFHSLVRAAVPNADPADVLKVFRRYRFVSLNDENVVQLLVTGFIPRGPKRIEALAVVLNSLELLTSTGYQNMRSRRRSENVGRFQRCIYVEHFNREYLRKFDEFTRKNAPAFLKLHEAWLQRREVRNVNRRRRRPRRVGIGVFGFDEL